MVFRIVLRNGLLVRRITYEPNRVRAHVTRFFIQYHFSCSVFAHCPHHLRFSLMTTLHVEFHPSNPTFRMVLRNGLLVSRITLWARSCSFLISLQLFIHFLHPHQATRFSSSSMISFVLKCISHLEQLIITKISTIFIIWNMKLVIIRTHLRSCLYRTTDITSENTRQPARTGSQYW